MNSEDRKALRPYGWLPGGYFATCATCGDYFLGAKGSVNCPLCAHARKQQEERVRIIEQDHESDGWPAIQTHELRAAADEIQRLREELAKREWRPINIEPHTRNKEYLCRLDDGQVTMVFYDADGVWVEMWGSGMMPVVEWTYLPGQFESMDKYDFCAIHRVLIMASQSLSPDLFNGVLSGLQWLCKTRKLPATPQKEDA